MNALALLAVLLAVLADAPDPARPPMHPKVTLLDREGRPVVESKGPVSPSRTCGSCHDTAYIAAHSYHAQAARTGRSNPARRLAGGPGMWVRAWRAAGTR
jgi:hypothetical protein